MIHVLQVFHVIKPIYHQIPVAFSYESYALHKLWFYQSIL